MLVYATKPGEPISTSTLREFRANTLSRDDVFQADFAANIVFYGSDETSLTFEPGVFEELTTWGVKEHLVLASASQATSTAVTPGPYVFSRGRTWQPWRVYHDFNACFMVSLKPSHLDLAR